jgi:hypothetical protein
VEWMCVWFVLVAWWDVKRVGFHAGNCMHVVDSSIVIPSL